MNFALKKLSKKEIKHLSIAGGVILFAVLAIILVNNSSSSVNGNSVVVPEEFIEARSEAGEIAEEITDLTRASRKNLDAISDADRGGDYRGGLELVTNEINRNAQIRQAAVELSEELKQMAIHAPNIEPDEASDVGVQAITSGLELVQHLVNYNNYTYELLETLETRLEGGDEEIARGRIGELLLNMNTEVEFVNALNEEYKQLSLQFDRITIIEE